MQTPYKDPEKRKRAARESMQRRRATPEGQADERRDKAVTRGGDKRYSTRYEASPEDDKGRHGFVDRLAYNYGHAEGGKPRVVDLKSAKVRRRRWGGDFEPDEPASDYARVVRLARRRTEPFRGKDFFGDDPDARRWHVYFSARGAHTSPGVCIDLARKIRRLGPDVLRVARALQEHSDLSPCSRLTLQQASQLGEGPFATAFLILRQQGLLREHTNTWPPEFTVKPPPETG